MSKPAFTLRPPSERASPADGNLSYFQTGTQLVFAHQDDDILWMLPFLTLADQYLLSAAPSAPMFEEVVGHYPASLGYQERWHPIWGTVDSDIWASIFTDACARESTVTVAGIKEHLRPYLQAGTKRVVTHNNWGEYGHYEHRLVNQAVRELAVEYKLDVWAPGIQIEWYMEKEKLRVRYINIGSELGLPMIEGYADPDLFDQIRRIYLEIQPTASTPERTERYRHWSATAWTWSDLPGDFPDGWRPYLQLVDQGSDLTVDHPGVSDLEQRVGITQACNRQPRWTKRMLLGLLKRELLGSLREPRS